MISIALNPSQGSISLAKGSSEEVRRLGDQFGRRHYVVLRGFLNGPLLERALGDVAAGEWEVREHKGISTELWQNRGNAVSRLWFLTNDPELFKLIDEITGCGEIRAFEGRVYRMLPGKQHEDSWHSDLGHGRLIAMSINLSPTPYLGGRLEIRERGSGKVLSRVDQTNLGDAVLFRIAPELEHKVGPLDGESPRTAYAGWFESDLPRGWMPIFGGAAIG